MSHIRLVQAQVLTSLSPEKTDFAEPLKENMDTMDHIQSHLHIDLIISKYVIMNNMSFHSNRELNILWIFLRNAEPVPEVDSSWVTDSQYISKKGSKEIQKSERIQQ